MLEAWQRQRYARHLLLAEIGELGQSRLCEARVGMPLNGDPDAAFVAGDYLERAGLEVQALSAGGRVSEVNVLDVEGVRALAGCAELAHAAAAFAGAFAAVEAIKAVLGVGAPAQLPSDLVLAEREQA
jgi:hypothetical protein